MNDAFHLQWHRWPAENPRGALVVAHGIGEHGGRYGHFVSALNGAGISVFAFDQRGHGLSPGKRGHINSWSEYRDDLAGFLALIRGREEFLSGKSRPAAPVFLFGHSMGAMVVLDFLIERPGEAAAAIVCGAPVQPAEVANPFLIFLARIFSRIWPTFTMKLGIKADQLSRDENVNKDSKDDPLNHRLISARWGTEILATIERVKNRAAEIRTPLLVLHGGADRINHPDGSRWLHDHVSSVEKKLIVYDGAHHEVHNDLCRDQVIADISEWLGPRL